ncbi:MAG: hypothetical protein WCK05_09755 [Planctomycetota bacterium]|jgi:hypothetical protein
MAAKTKQSGPPLPPPIDVVDGVPDHASATPLWRYLLLAGLFVGWVVFLILVRVLGQG